MSPSDAGGESAHLIDEPQDAATLLAECRAVLDVAAPVLPEPPQTITSGTAQPVSLQADLSRPAVLGTLPRYRLFQFVTDCWECPDGEWVKFEDVAQIVSALQHEIAQLTSLLSYK